MLSPAAVWLIAGVVLCLMELFLPTAFVEFAMGISAIIVALLTPFLPQLGIQITLWLVLSVILVLVVRRFVPTGKPRIIEDDKEGTTITEIPVGRTGRVLYEGNSWQARCGDETLAIAANQAVYIIGRKGTTLIVMPDHLLHS